MAATRRAAGAVLWLLASLGAAGAMIWVASATGLARPLVVVSDSMRPAFAAGDLLVAVRTPTERLRPGDIVAVQSAVDSGASARLVAHRIVAATRSESGWALRLRGDANPVEDPDAYPVEAGVLRIVATWPGAGRFVEGVSRPAVAVPLAVALIAVLALAVLGAGARPRPLRQRRRGRVRHPA